MRKFKNFPIQFIQGILEGFLYIINRQKGNPWSPVQSYFLQLPYLCYIGWYIYKANIYTYLAFWLFITLLAFFLFIFIR